MGIKTVAGGKHVENLPKEALANNIDVVVFREGEITIKELLLTWQKSHSLDVFLVIGQEIVSQKNHVKTIQWWLVQQLVNLPTDSGPELFVYQPGSPTDGLKPARLKGLW